ncbi:hypothetical protein OS493_019426 [Desmophyllum pertusum]|uniref:Uncharacterized protein n=1 Tax=Desmophyllum pertusum TaxID=174260 RepID=A0A9X0A1W0_9CNID|nr:hypothetical protein OS493_019426 [Desmophyllum pertusum]
MLDSYVSLAEEIGLKEEAKAANHEISLLSRTSEGRQYHINLQSQFHQNAYDEALKQIYDKVMKKLRHHSSWVLLIKDPTKEMSRFKRFWPQPGDPSFGNGLVIMTTQCPKLLLKEGGDLSLKKVLIGKMANKDAVAFLASKSGIPATGTDKTYAEDIAVNKLHSNPQDIAQLGTIVEKYKEETNKRTFRDLSTLWRTETATLSEYMLILEMTRRDLTKIFKFLACCSSENHLPLKILERCFTEATEAAEDSEVLKIAKRDGIKVVTTHPRHHATLRDILSRQQPTETDQTWMDVFRGNGVKNIETPTLSRADVSQVIECLSSVCKDALQRCRDEDFVMLRSILPHLKEAVQLGSKLTVEGELEPLVMADGYACLGESLLFSGDSEEARSNLKIALAMYKDYKGPENVQLDLANVLHFLGEAYSNSHLGNPLKGEIYLREALEKKMDFYNGMAHQQIAFTLRSLGNVLNELGQQSEAIVHIKRALRMYDDSENCSNLKQEYGYTLSALGSSYRYLGRYVQAEYCLKKALKIFRSVDSPSKLRVIYHY